MGERPITHADRHHAAMQTYQPGAITSGQRKAIVRRLHNCTPNAATGHWAPHGTEWACPCGKRWRKGNYGGWTRVDP